MFRSICIVASIALSRGLAAPLKHDGWQEHQGLNRGRQDHQAVLAAAQDPPQDTPQDDPPPAEENPSPAPSPPADWHAVPTDWKFWVMTLDDNPDRRTLFDQGKQYLPQMEKFMAYDGRNDEGRLRILEDLKANALGFNFMGQPTWPTLGCWMTHWATFRKQVDEGIPFVLRMEDDFSPGPDFIGQFLPLVKQYYENDPNFDGPLIVNLNGYGAAWLSNLNGARKSMDRFHDIGVSENIDEQFQRGMMGYYVENPIGDAFLNIPGNELQDKSERSTEESQYDGFCPEFMQPCDDKDPNNVRQAFDYRLNTTENWFMGHPPAQAPWHVPKQSH